MLKIFNKIHQNKLDEYELERNFKIDIKIVNYTYTLGRTLIDCVDVQTNEKYICLIIDQDTFKGDEFESVDQLCLKDDTTLQKNFLFGILQESYKFKNKKRFQIKIKFGFIHGTHQITIFEKCILKITTTD